MSRVALLLYPGLRLALALQAVTEFYPYQVIISRPLYYLGRKLTRTKDASKREGTQA